MKDLGRLETVVREEDNGTEDYRGDRWGDDKLQVGEEGQWRREGQVASCLLYTSDAADECVNV